MNNKAKLAARYQVFTGLMTIVLGIQKKQQGFMTNGFTQLGIADKIDKNATYEALDEIHNYLLNLSENVYPHQTESEKE
jgi:hypothetical protein